MLQLRSLLAFALIIGGGNAAVTPYMLRLRTGPLHCAAVLIEPQWALTAAHCIDPTFTDQLPDDATLEEIAAIATVTVNEYDLSITDPGEHTVGVAAIFLFGYQFGQWPNHDIALLRLAEPANAQPITITLEAQPAGTSVEMYGWGNQGYTPRNPILQRGSAILIEYTNTHFITQGQATAGSGDSGGAVVANGQLIGVISGAGSLTTAATSIAHYAGPIHQTMYDYEQAHQAPCIEIAPGVCLESEPGHYPPIFLPLVLGSSKAYQP